MRTDLQMKQCLSACKPAYIILHGKLTDVEAAIGK